MRATRVLGTALAYIGAGIPAAIGIAFVARFAFVTSDTPTDGAATAFLFAMVASGAFLGPAIAIAVGNRGHKAAAGLSWLLALLAIVANWTHTLGAIAQRGAGIEARGAKITADTDEDSTALARLERELGPMRFSATTAEAVAAARSAAELAERNRKAECGPNNETRGERCRARELEEQAKRDMLAKVVSEKAAADRASQLATEAAGIRKSLADAPVALSSNALSNVLGRVLSIPALTAATIQQGFVSAIVELLIAAVSSTMTRPNYQMIAQGALAIAALRLRVPKWVKSSPARRDQVASARPQRAADLLRRSTPGIGYDHRL